ncbi:hypothetical protein ACH4VQ_37265, partial [Streptomyces anulatus]
MDLRLSPQRNAFESSCSMSVACEIIIVAFGFCRTVRAERAFCPGGSVWERSAVVDDCGVLVQVEAVGEI